jgi:hypothetical protein
LSVGRGYVRFWIAAHPDNDFFLASVDGADIWFGDEMRADRFASQEDAVARIVSVLNGRGRPIEVVVRKDLIE